MTAELLRRAAATLRESVAAMDEGIRADWTSDGAEIYAGPTHEWVAETLHVENASDERIADYIALMRPPVALALAVVFEGLAVVVDSTIGDAAAADIFENELALARAVLREASS